MADPTIGGNSGGNSSSWLGRLFWGSGEATNSTPTDQQPKETYISRTPNDDGAYGSLYKYFTSAEYESDKNEFFGPGDYYTEKMRQHPGVVDSLAKATQIVANDCEARCDSEASGKISFSLGNKSFLGQVGDFFSVMFGAATGGVIGKDPDYGTVGSFSSSSAWNVDDVSCISGTATLEMKVENEMSAASNTRYGYSSADQTVLSENPLGEKGPFGTLHQEWNWTEEVKFSPVEDCDS